MDKQNAIGKAVSVAAVCIGSVGERDAKLKLAIDHLHTAGQHRVDIACLPEAFAGTVSETVPGPTTDAIGELARQYQMYVICPICEQDGEEHYNTVVLIDRQGEIVGVYRKIYVFWGEERMPSRDGVKIFDADFGRIGIFTCFDVNFPELWQEADALDAEIVFWPSAYGGGMPLNAFAMLYHYYIVPVGWGNIIDITGENMTDFRRPRDQMFLATLDLDRTLIHTNFNGEKMARLLQEHVGEAVQERFYEMESWHLLRATKPGVSVRDLCKEYQIETLREYLHRSRKQIDEIRQSGGVV